MTNSIDRRNFSKALVALGGVLPLGAMTGTVALASTSPLANAIKAHADAKAEYERTISTLKALRPIFEQQQDEQWAEDFTRQFTKAQKARIGTSRFAVEVKVHLAFRRDHEERIAEIIRPLQSKNSPENLPAELSWTKEESPSVYRSDADNATARRMNERLEATGIADARRKMERAEKTADNARLALLATPTATANEQAEKFTAISNTHGPDKGLKASELSALIGSVTGASA